MKRKYSTRGIASQEEVMKNENFAQTDWRTYDGREIRERVAKVPTECLNCLEIPQIKPKDMQSILPRRIKESVRE
tara:strand:- start:5 stop:229 length:225 start_codon:yes stop_codon:yes gene_type:complete